MKSKPLADVTNNFNLIPLSTLRKLCQSTKTFNEKPSNSKISKPYNANCSNLLPTAAVKKGSDSKAASNCSSKSDTSIGSSSFVQNATAGAGFTSPSRWIAPPPTPPLGHESSEIIYGRRQMDVKAKRAREVVPVSIGSCPPEKKIGKRNAITTPEICPITLEKTADKGKRTDVLPVPSGYPHEKAKDKGKAIAVLSSHPFPLKNKEDKGKAIAVPSNDLPSETSNNKGKAVLCPLSCLPGKTEDKEKSVVMPSTLLHLNKMEQKKKKELAISSCPPLPRTRKRSKISDEVTEVGYPKSAEPHKKQTKRRCNSEFSLPRDFVEQQRAYFKEVDEFELAEEEVSCNELDT